MVCVVCVQSDDVSFEQYAGKGCGYAPASVFEQANIPHKNQSLTNMRQTEMAPLVWTEIAGS